MRRTEAAPDPDSARRPVTLPASWDDVPPPRRWPRWHPAAARPRWPSPRRPGSRRLPPPPPPPVSTSPWPIGCTGCCCCGGERRPRRFGRRKAEDGPGFVLNLSAFLDSDGQLDLADFAEAVETAVIALTFAAPEARDIDVGMADLAGLLALWASTTDPRRRATWPAALRRSCVAGRMPPPGAWHGSADERPAPFDWPVPPPHTPVRGLLEAARAARQDAAAVEQLRHRATTAISRPGLAEALLGCETGGIAPAFSASKPGRRADPRRPCLACGQRRHRRGGPGHHPGRRHSDPDPWRGGARRHARRGGAVCTRHAAAPGAAGGEGRRRHTGATCPGGAAATPRRRRSAATSCSCAPASMRTARWARSSSP